MIKTFVKAIGYDVLFYQFVRFIQSDYVQRLEDDVLALLGLQRVGRVEMKAWTVPAHVNRVVDGNTLMCTLDLGWGISLRQYVQLTGISIPKESTAEATELVQDLLPPDTEVTIVSKKVLGQTEKYGRILAAVRLLDGTDLSTEVLSHGHARQYSG